MGDSSEYVCPGETHPISRSVHLSRLASFFPACRDCPHRHETGHLTGKTAERLRQTETTRDRSSLFTDEGVRGVYLNQLSRKQAHLIAAAVASLLWEQTPLRGNGRAIDIRGSRSFPRVLVGHDERPASPDLMAGVMSALRRMSCQVTDVGVISKPGFWFAGDHLQIHAGIYVHGGGCSPSEMAIDFLGPNGCPVSRSTRNGEDSAVLTLDRIESAIRDPYSRATRQAGPYQTFQANVPYEAGLWKHFQGVGPLRVVVGTGSTLIQKTLSRLFQTLPAEFSLLTLPKRSRNPIDPGDEDSVRVSAFVMQSQADLGVLIDDDGQRCAFFDEQGQMLSVVHTTKLLATAGQRDAAPLPVVLEDFATGELESFLKGRGVSVVRGGTTRAQIAQSLRGHNARFAGGASGQYWFRESFPTCDAIITTAAMLQLISRRQQKLSTLVRELAPSRPKIEC